MDSSDKMKLPYQRLKNEAGIELDDDVRQFTERLNVIRLRRCYGYKRAVGSRRRVRVRVRVPSLRRFLKRKARDIRVGISQLLKRLKESQSHLGDLFAGNYLFMHVNPAPLRCAVEKSRQGQNRNSVSMFPKIS